ncbi:ATP synthase F1 subunit delta [Zongyangia hominis]|uniref:ATP synthase subunit delta n=1 Tax=Zongyangia hominis TaxID=2763677 RepID=A0A926ECG9_9FIRM|nr:ATP synthase F1 subunit delta [Zongyangia hominis]MBC8569839.1 ATP synthase F1 subunit delta [Zongyangia hominis]
MAEVVAKTYASSLYETAKAAQCEEEILEELRVLDEAFLEDGDFLILMQSPELNRSEKMDLIDRIFRGKVHPYTENFLKVLTEKRRIKHFHAIFASYNDIYNSDHNRMEFTAVTAVALSDTLKERLRRKLKMTTGAEIVLHTQVDPALLGGMVLRFQNEQIDASVKSKLEDIRRKISAVIA